MSYSFLQIVLFFFIYCFIGWIWETAYVSIKNKRFVNRGFLHEPMIPIYGFGAMSILFATLPVKNNLFLVFVFGMIAASVLELVTGCVMESIFHVRYWDYTNIPTNIKGYISLPTSIVWGIFSILMIKYVHAPIERWVLGFSPLVTEITSMLCVSVGSMDLAISVTEAFDLKALLARINEAESVKRFQHRRDMVAALLDSDLENIKTKINERVSVLEKGEYRRIKSILDRNPSARSNKYQHIFAEVRNSLKDKRKMK